MITAAPPVQAIRETDIVLRDGTTVHVRPTTAEDEPRLRIFSGGVDLDLAARIAATPADGLSLVALRGPEGTVVGHGTCLLADLAQSASSEGIEPVYAESERGKVQA